jgi:hypothetical protein
MHPNPTMPQPQTFPLRVALYGFLGSLAALLLVGAVAGTLALTYRATAPHRERAALEAELADYAAWYDANTYRQSVGVGVFEGYRDNYIQRHPRLEQYLLWWQGWRRAQPDGSNLIIGSRIKAIRPAEVANPAALDDYFAR